MAHVQVSTKQETAWPHYQKAFSVPTARKCNMQAGTGIAPSLSTFVSTSMPPYQMSITDSTLKATTHPPGSVNPVLTTCNLKVSDQWVQDMFLSHIPCSPTKMDGKQLNEEGIPQVTSADPPPSPINPRTAPPKTTYLRSGPKKHPKHPRPPMSPPDASQDSSQSSHYSSPPSD